MKKVNLLLIICIVFGMFSCSVDNLQNKTDVINNKAYININIAEGRTINPQTIDLTTLTYELTGLLNGNNVNLGEFTYQQLLTANKELDLGEWDFTLVAKKSNQNVLVGTIVQKSIVFGNNTLSFNMTESTTGTGEIAVTVLMPKNTVAKTEFVLTESLTDETKDSTGVSVIDCTEDISKSKAIYTFSSADKGYYNLKISLFQNANDTTPINKRTVVVRVEPGCTSSGNVVFDKVNTTYTITYHFNGEEIKSDYILPITYNGCMQVTLPKETDMTGDINFYGWYDNQTFNGNEISLIEYESTGNKEYWLKTFVEKSCSDLSSYLSTLGGKVCNVKITDTSPDMEEIKDALQANPTARVNIDLSMCTGLTAIEQNALSDCKSLVGLVIPDNVNVIGEGTLSGCDNIVNLTIPFVGGSKDAVISSESTTLTYIFDQCEIPLSLRSVTVTGGNLLDSAFSEGCNLTNIELYEGIKSIGVSAFEDCSGITALKIPDSVTSIGYYAFGNCSGLTEIKISKNVTNIEPMIFFGCSALENVVIDPDNPKYEIRNDCIIDKQDNAVIEGLKNVSDIPDGITVIGDYAFPNCSGFTSIDISDKITYIGENAFISCTEITSIKISKSVTDIELAPFYGCSSLESIVVDSANTKYDSRENCNAIIDKTNNSLIVGCKNTVIPNGVISIGESAFAGCDNLTSIEIPVGVTSIGDEAFEGCYSLTNIEISNSVTSIGSGVFCECNQLENIELPENITDIGDSAFVQCSGLTTLTCKAMTPPTLGEEILVGCSSLTAIYVPSESVDAYKSATGWSSYASKIIEIPSGE